MGSYGKGTVQIIVHSASGESVYQALLKLLLKQVRAL